MLVFWISSYSSYVLGDIRHNAVAKLSLFLIVYSYSICVSSKVMLRLHNKTLAGLDLGQITVVVKS